MAGMNGLGTYACFRNHFLSTRANFVPIVTSCAYDTLGDRVTLSAVVINATAGATCLFQLQGSMDGNTWQVINSFNLNQFGYAQATTTGLNFPFVRVGVTLSGTDVDVLYGATIAFTDRYNV